MKWTVTWLPSAERTLTDLWVNAPDRNAVAAAANRIDQDLERDPLSAGESRQGDTRIHIVEPLAVLFDVDPAQRTVTVWSVWRIS
jgi:hypothetical protein